MNRSLLCLGLLGLMACNRGTVAGQVTDRDGKPVSGVQVALLGLSTKTDSKGRFRFTKLKDLPEKRVVLSFKKNGFFDFEGGQKVVENSAYLKVALTPREKVGTVEATEASSVDYDTMHGEFPANGWVNTSTGEPVTGQVSIYAGIMNPDRDGFAESMPGRDFVSGSGRSSGMLSSAGAFVIEAEDEEGNAVDLTEPADVCLDIPASMLAVAPDVMPLWQLGGDGSWYEVGSAERVGDQYCFRLIEGGSLNCDMFSRTAAIQGTVCNTDGEPVGEGQPVHIFQNTTYTDENGMYGALVPACYNFIARYRARQKEVPGIPASMTRVVDFNCPVEDTGFGASDTGGYAGRNPGETNPFANGTGGAGENNSSGNNDNDPFANTASTSSSRSTAKAHNTSSASNTPSVSVQKKPVDSSFTGMLASGVRWVIDTWHAAFVKPFARLDSGNFDTGGAPSSPFDTGGDSGTQSSGSSRNSGAGFAGPDDVCTSGSDPFVQQAAGSAGQITCDGVSEAGSDAPFSRTVSLDSNSGSISLTYDHYGIPDRTIVSYEGSAIADSGCASGAGTISGNYSGRSSSLTISVVPGCGDSQNSGTSWEFQLGCN